MFVSLDRLLHNNWNKSSEKNQFVTQFYINSIQNQVLNKLEE